VWGRNGMTRSHERSEPGLESAPRPWGGEVENTVISYPVKRITVNLDTWEGQSGGTESCERSGIGEVQHRELVRRDTSVDAARKAPIPPFAVCYRFAAEPRSRAESQSDGGAESMSFRSHS
jgi:hypothetical protein